MSHQCHNRGRKISTVHFNWKHVNKKPAYIWISIKLMSTIFEMSHIISSLSKNPSEGDSGFSLPSWTSSMKSWRHFITSMGFLRRCASRVHTWMNCSLCGWPVGGEFWRICWQVQSSERLLWKRYTQCKIHSLGFSSLHSSNASLHIRNKTWKSFLNPPWGSTILCRGMTFNIFLAEGASKPSRPRLTYFLWPKLKTDHPGSD